MKQKFILLMTLIAAVITFSACSSDDDDKASSNSPIVGTWYGEDGGYATEFLFTSGGAVTATETKLSVPTSRVRDTGTYRLNGNKLTIRWTKFEIWNNFTQKWVTDDEEVETVVLTIGINGNKLTFYSMEGEEDGDPIVYTRR